MPSPSGRGVVKASQLDQLVNRILASYQMTAEEQRFLMSTLLAKESLSPADCTLINKVYEGLKKGLVRVID
uniref:Uncharacterized protein n=1 Tax=Desertifilum tharense IPPAS B-1220 TaxID=1781255 RepID=A0A1E5QL46_9CYAN|nr:hypothetical protein BH720_10105 [Desertifilum tharense IPPAS B-1220]